MIKEAAWKEEQAERFTGMKPLFVIDTRPTCQGKRGADSTFENLSWCGCTRLTNRWMLSCSANEMRLCWFSVIEKKLILFVRDFPKLQYNWCLSHRIEDYKTNLEGILQGCKMQDSIWVTYCILRALVVEVVLKSLTCIKVLNTKICNRWCCLNIKIYRKQ